MCCAKWIVAAWVKASEPFVKTIHEDVVQKRPSWQLVALQVSEAQPNKLIGYGVVALFVCIILYPCIFFAGPPESRPSLTHVRFAFTAPSPHPCAVSHIAYNIRFLAVLFITISWFCFMVKSEVTYGYLWLPMATYVSMMFAMSENRPRKPRRHQGHAIHG